MSPVADRPDVSVEDCLKLLWQLDERGVPASNSEVAERLDLPPGTVSELFSKLKEENLVDYQPYEKPRLSEEGRQRAARLVRRHRLIETFLVEELGYGWGEVHAEAHTLEHHVSETFINRLDEHLGDPEFDPHGAPIPARDGSSRKLEGVPLTEVEEGETVRVSQVWDDHREVLAYLGEVGIGPGSELTVTEQLPLGDGVRVQYEGDTLVLPTKTSESVQVHPGSD